MKQPKQHNQTALDRARKILAERKALAAANEARAAIPSVADQAHNVQPSGPLAPPPPREGLSAIEMLKQKQAQHSSPNKAAIPTIPTTAHTIDTLAADLEAHTGKLFNDRQLEAINAVMDGEWICVSGAAGTGKTTTQEGIVYRLLSNNKVPALGMHDHKYLPQNSLGIVITAYTRKATNNIKAHMPEELKGNCITIHKLIEFEPYFYTVIDADGEEINKMEFLPKRNIHNPLMPEIKYIIFEEASMIDLPLFAKFWAAINHDIQIIFLGDINQLPPVFGSSIYGFALIKYRAIELTHVYRQALNSPIISLAHRILAGKPMNVQEVKALEKPGELEVSFYKKKLSPDSALTLIDSYMRNAYKTGKYNPMEDMVLTPYNESFGTIAMNANIADMIAEKENRVVYEIVAGFNKKYLAVGDRVFVDREDGIVKDIKYNAGYYGVTPLPASNTMNYYGYPRTLFGGNAEITEDTANREIDIDAFLAQAASNDVSDKVNKASHKVTIYIPDRDVEVELSTAAELNNMQLGYALTVYKAQGSEYRKVYFLTHRSQNTQLFREMLYTAVTRAKEHLAVVGEKTLFEGGITRQRIQGNTLAEKAEYFKGKVDVIPETLESILL